MCLVLPLVFTGGKAYDRHSAALCRRVSLGTDIPPVTYGRFSHPELGPLLPNPIPDTVCCVPLFSRRVFVHPQNLVDNSITGPSLGFARTGSLRSGRTALSACPNIRRCTPSCLATPRTAPTPKRYCRRICSNSSTLRLLSITLPVLAGMDRVGRSIAQGGAKSDGQTVAR